MDITILDTSIRQDSEGRFSLNDLHRASGGDEHRKPTRFLRSSAIKTLVSELDSRLAPVSSLKINRGGNDGGKTFAHKFIAAKYAEFLGGNIAKEFLSNIGFDAVVLEHKRREFVFGDEIVNNLFRGYKIIKQFPVFDGKYRIDWYIPELKLAIEFDEIQHSYSPAKKLDARRQVEIEQCLGCRFIRYTDYNLK